MKKTLFALFAALSVASCQKADFVQDIFPQHQPFDVTVNAGMGADTTQTRVNAAGLDFSWAAGDRIGLFAGPDNCNVPFTLSSGQGTQNATFGGSMYQATSQTLYSYYPYDSYNTNPTNWQVTLEGQEYDGDYSKDGISSNFGKFAFMAAAPISGFSISKSIGWPNSTGIGFGYRFVSIVSFEITNSMSSDVTIDRIGIRSSAGNVLFNLVSINITSMAYSFSSVNEIGTDLATPLTLKADNASGKKYVHMAALVSNFGSGADIDIIANGSIGGKSVQLVCSKHVNSAQNIKLGTRTTITMPITDAMCNYPHLVTIGQNGGSLETPEFSKDGSDYSSDITSWGDGSQEQYYGGSSHQYSKSGAHTVSVSCWGTSNSVRFDNLENISSIDFSKF